MVAEYVVAITIWFAGQTGMNTVTYEVAAQSKEQCDQMEEWVTMNYKLVTPSTKGHLVANCRLKK